MVVHPGTVQKVCVQWPVLANDEFVKLSEQRMLWEFCGFESDLKDEMCVQLVGRISPLRVGQQARACRDVLFFNPSEKTVSILAGDVIGCAKLAGQGMVNPEWRRAMESCNLIMTMGADRSADQAPTTERVQQLVQQLGLMDNRLLAQHPEVRSKLIALVTRYESVFTDSDVAVGKTDLLKMKIVLEPDVTPVRAAVRRIKPSLQSCLREQLDSWLKDGVIAPAVSPWGSPLVPVAKKDGTTRWAVDYRELNKYTLPDAYPTPCLSHIVESLAGSRVFSSLDAAQAFHNVPIEEDSQDATAFVCMYGLFKFLRMPFGLRNAGAVYCRLVAQIMDNLGLQSVAHYLDDILIHTAEVEEHLDSVEQVLRAHSDAGIRLKPSKTLFFQEQVEFLGFQVSGDGITPTDRYIRAIRDMQAPKTGKEVASLLGFLGYYREFIPAFARLTEEMNSLRNKRQLTDADWTPEINANFRKLRSLFLEQGGPVRHFPIPLGQVGGGEFILHIDWSKWGMAGVLYQRQHDPEKPVFIGAVGRKCSMRVIIIVVKVSLQH